LDRREVYNTIVTFAIEVTYVVVFFRNRESGVGIVNPFGISSIDTTNTCDTRPERRCLGEIGRWKAMIKQ